MKQLRNPGKIVTLVFAPLKPEGFITRGKTKSALFSSETQIGNEIAENQTIISAGAVRFSNCKARSRFLQTSEHAPSMRTPQTSHEKCWT
jgi:hypothetical protein